MPWDRWSIIQSRNTTIRWWTGGECGASIKSAINVPVLSPGWLMCITCSELKTGSTSMDDMIGNFSTEEILEVW